MSSLADFDFGALHALGRGEIRAPAGSGESLGTYELWASGDGATITLSEAGRALFAVARGSEPLEVDDPLVFAGYLGLQIESGEDLRKRLGKARGDASTCADVLEYARAHSDFGLGEPEAGPARQIITPTDRVIGPGTGPDECYRIAKENLVRFGTREIAAAYRLEGATLVPVMLKSLSGASGISDRAHEARMMAYEHAALTGMRAAGLAAVRSAYFVDSLGNAVLMTDRFDRKPVKATATLDGYAHAPPEHLIFASETWQACVANNRYAQLLPHQALARALVTYRQDPEHYEAVLAQALFNRLIGNTDAHGANLGSIVEIGSDGLQKSPCPAFDVTPHLLDPANRESAKEAGLTGCALGRADLQQILAGDEQLMRIERLQPNLMGAAYARAIAAREAMTREIARLSAEGVIDKSEPEAFARYLGTPIAEPALASSVGGSSPGAIERFMAKARAQLGCDQVEEIALGVPQPA